MEFKFKQISIGVDPSYANTGISIAADNKLLKVSSVPLAKCKNNSQRRAILSNTLDAILSKVVPKGQEVVCIIERARIHGGSTSFINIDAIKGIGALTATVVDRCAMYDVPVYSVDTRCWKSQVVGTSKGQTNCYGVPPEKWPTVLWACKQGFKRSICHPVQGRATKGTFLQDGVRYKFDNDAADSSAIATYWFVGDRNKLKEEH